jgi:hypothetical protein
MILNDYREETESLQLRGSLKNGVNLYRGKIQAYTFWEIGMTIQTQSPEPLACTNLAGPATGDEVSTSCFQALATKATWQWTAWVWIGGFTSWRVQKGMDVLTIWIPNKKR